MKNNLKKMLSVLMVIVMVLSLAACGGKTETAAPADGAAARTDIIIGVAAEPSSLDPCMSAGASISEANAEVAEGTDVYVKFVMRHSD